MRDSGFGSSWQGDLSVVIAANEAEFTARTGVAAAAASAVTTCTDGVSEIVVNPAVLAADEAWLDSTLIHETVHVATGSACRAPGEALAWVSEGVAEHVAAAADPATAARNRRLLRDYLAEHAAAQAELPQRLDTLTDYALAELAVAQVEARLGPESAEFLDRAGRRAAAVTAYELAQVRSWYRAALVRLA